MAISAIDQAAPIAPVKSDASKASLNYDAFLKLLLQQLKSQDPLNPVDQTQSLAQLAQFSTVEQTIKLNEKLDRLLQNSAVAEAGSLIGKTATSLVDGRSGVVKAVEIISNNTFIVLSDGERLPVSQAVRIGSA